MKTLLAEQPTLVPEFRAHDPYSWHLLGEYIGDHG